MPNQPKTPARAIRVSDELWQAVKAKAGRQGTSITGVIVAGLNRYLDEPVELAVRAADGAPVVAAVELQDGRRLLVQREPLADGLRRGRVLAALPVEYVTAEAVAELFAPEACEPVLSLVGAAATEPRLDGARLSP